MPRRKRETKLNKIEEEYAWMLEVEKRKGNISSWAFEGRTFELGEPKKYSYGTCKYTPDFMIVYSDGHIEYHELKGTLKGTTRSTARDDALVKFKCARRIYKNEIFRIFQHTKFGWIEKYEKKGK